MSDRPEWTPEQLAEKLAIALELPYDYRSVAVSMQCLAEDDPRRLKLANLFERASNLCDDGNTEELEDVKIEILELLVTMRQ